MYKFSKYLIATALGAAAFAVSLSGQADTIKVGFNVPLTGFAAADGKSARHDLSIVSAYLGA